MNELGASNMYKDYSRNASCALRISTFVLLSLDLCFCCWNSSNGGIIHPVVSVSL